MQNPKVKEAGMRYAEKLLREQPDIPTTRLQQRVRAFNGYSMDASRAEVLRVDGFDVACPAKFNFLRERYSIIVAARYAGEAIPPLEPDAAPPPQQPALHLAPPEPEAEMPAPISLPERKSTARVQTPEVDQLEAVFGKLLTAMDARGIHRIEMHINGKVTIDRTETFQL